MTEPTRTEWLELYKLHAELADRVSQRREAANRLHIGILSALGVVASVFVKIGTTESLDFVFLAVGILGLVVSTSWWAVIRSYRQLNSGKFKVLDELEDEIVFPFFRREWEVLKTGKKNRYWELTNVESFLPVVFGILFVAVIIIGLTQN